MKFSELQELVRLITRHKAKDIELLGDASEEESGRKLNQLYDGITRGQFENDDEAAAYLYGEKANASHSEYRRLRNRLVKQLLNTIFFIDIHQPKFSEYTRMAFQIYKDFAAAALLLSRDARLAGLFLMNQVVEIGIKYEFTELVADAAKMMRSIYAGSIGNAALHEKYTKIHQEYEQKRRLEADAFEEYQYVLKHYIGGPATNQTVYDHTLESFPRLMEKAQNVDTVNYYFYTYSVGVAHFSSNNDAENALRLCDEAIEIIQHREMYAKGKMIVFFVNKLHFMTQLRQFDPKEGQKTYEQCLNNLVEGESNWFKFLHVWLHHNLHAGNYAVAFEVYQQAIKHPRFSLMTGLTAEIWHIYHGYFQLLVALRQLPPHNSLGEFRAKRFINNFIVLAKERTGLHIPILLLPVLFSLLPGRNAEDAPSPEALDKHRQRYLQNDQNLRSATFIKLLTALAKRPFEPEKAHRRIQAELQELSLYPIEKSGQSYIVEIIPYETLFQILIGVKDKL